MGGVESLPTDEEILSLHLPIDSRQAKYDCDKRPPFLELSDDQLQDSKSHEKRVIVQPNSSSRLPWNAGYAETINAGKSYLRNEDQTSYAKETLRHVTKYEASDSTQIRIPVHYFGVFDGHAGGETSTFAAHACHQHVITNLNGIRELLASDDKVIEPEEDVCLGYSSPRIKVEDLVRGALEEAFIGMDEQLRRDRLDFSIKGGCTAMAALFVERKLYVANAGDSRSIIVKGNGDIVEMSKDYTPETDRQRVQAVAYYHPKLLGDFFGRLQFQRRVRRKDVGKQILYRDKHMTGWALKIVTEDDIKMVPMVTGEGKRARLLSTIGTTRGFGDFDLEAPGGLRIKPFMTAMPEVRMYDLSDENAHGDDDVLIMASDGLWERITNEEARDVVRKLFLELGATDTQRYARAAHHLVLAARGHLTQKGWRTEKEEFASGDDITCFVVPLKGASIEMNETYRQRETK
ncbi:protein phosphatase 1H-like [Oscarella lobularis]|uniref:protein phosphatase 1H-like n=1 Tax=Oscarella lobularis TaxID=121494 RepID=UPI0033137C15